ncbi:MAG: hypothetical protein IPG81_27205 [Sandaracinaceae bacterium]|nr:hypothetical protein [Sandaracinaceae bacterium]
MEAKLRQHEVPLLSLESGRPLRDFDIVGFSLQFELTYTNILQMLDLGGIPRWAHERGETDPLVIAGGPVATHAEPIAPFIDVFLIGDGEAKLPEVMLAWAALRDAGVPRRERLVALAKLGGLYVPALYETMLSPDTGLLVVEPGHPDAPYPVERTFVANLDEYPFPTGGPVARHRDHLRPGLRGGGARLHRGLPLRQAGMIYRPARARAAADHRHHRDGREERRLRRGLAHVAVHRRLQRHRAAGAADHEGPRGAARERERELAARLRPERGRAGRHEVPARRRPDVRARGGHAAHARRGEQERHRGTADDHRRARVLARLVEDEALLRDRLAHRRKTKTWRASSGRGTARGSEAPRPAATTVARSR